MKYPTLDKQFYKTEEHNTEKLLDILGESCPNLAKQTRLVRKALLKLRGCEAEEVLVKALVGRGLVIDKYEDLAYVLTLLGAVPEVAMETAAKTMTDAQIHDIDAFAGEYSGLATTIMAASHIYEVLLKYLEVEVTPDVAAAVEHTNHLCREEAKRLLSLEQKKPGSEEPPF